MEQFAESLMKAGSTVGFQIPPGFLYQGGSPASVRSFLIENLAADGEAGDGARMALYVGMAVSLAGSRLTTEGSAHAKH